MPQHHYAWANEQAITKINGKIYFWKYPALLGTLTIFGLLSALTGTGFWHVLAWIAMSVPVFTCIRFGFFQNVSRDQED